MVRACLAAFAFLFTLGVAQADRPNIVIVLADDMGHGDLGCMGSEKLITPHLDALAASGVLCSQGYVASPVCSPSRWIIDRSRPASFRIRRKPEQFGGKLRDSPRSIGPSAGRIYPWRSPSCGRVCNSTDRQVASGIRSGFHPNARGFDHFCGMLGGSHTYFPKPGKHTLERNGTPLKEWSSPYLTDFFTDEGLRWIAHQHEADPSRPWFIFMSYNAPHGPLEATAEDLAKFEHIATPKRRTYAAMMLALDRGVGRLRAQLKATGQLEKTLIVFFSDNGGATGNASWNGTLSGSKGCLKEGGVRVPMIWSWPTVLPAGQRHDAPISSLDLLPSFLAAAESEPLSLADPKSHEDKNNRNRAVERFGAYDGVNVLPQLRGQATAKPRTLFWRLQGQAAVLDGDEKLIRLSHRPAQMFRPASDVGEHQDLAATETARFHELFQQLGQWESTLPTVPLWGSSPYWIGQSAETIRRIGRPARAGMS